MRRSRSFLLVPLLVGLALCAPRNAQGAQPEPAIPSATQEAPLPFFSQEGLASRYGGARKGKTTADGEHFRPGALTGAHRSLPFNTVVRVTDLKSGKTVKMRINDRGPFVKRRIIDLSAAAAALLGMVKHGIEKVRVEAFAADQSQSACRTARHGLALLRRCRG